VALFRIKSLESKFAGRNIQRHRHASFTKFQVQLKFSESSLTSGSASINALASSKVEAGTVERCLACEADSIGTVERCLALNLYDLQSEDPGDLLNVFRDVTDS
jgi:hypothetical protein